MLTPSYILHMADVLVGMYDALDRVIIAEITKQISRNGKILAVWENETYRRRVMQEIERKTLEQVAVTTGYTIPEIERMFRDAVKTSKKLDLNPLILNGVKVDLSLTPAQAQIVNAALSTVGAEITNLTGTLGVTASGLYEKYVNEAFLQVANGVYSPQRALCEAVLGIVKDGNWVMYPSGHRDRIDVAVARSVRTGISRTCGEITLNDCDELDCKLVETSAHAGARLEHTYWQGQVFSLDGKGDYPDFYEETGYGEGDGLCGYNCRHSFYPFWENISQENYDRSYLDWATDPTRYEYDGDYYSEYDFSQLLRSKERAIRETKRKLAGLNSAIKSADNSYTENFLNEQRDRAQARLDSQKSEYKKLCRIGGRQPTNSRTAVYAVQDENGNILRFDRKRGTR